jgi:hypothetical protein
MHSGDRESQARTQRVQELCRQLTQLVSRSLDQRRAIDRLVAELEAIARLAARIGIVPAGGAGEAAAAAAGGSTASPHSPTA